MTSIKDKNRGQRFIERAYGAFFTPGPYEARPEQEQVLARGETYRLAWGGGEMAVTTWGAGPTALLVHGWGGARAQMTGFVGPLLEAGYRAVAFDQPAHGESDGRMTNIFTITTAMEALAAREGPFRAVLAHSFGTLAVSYALITNQDIPKPERLVYFGAFNRLMDTLPRFQALSGLPDSIIDGLRKKMDAEFGEGAFEPIVNAYLVRELDIPALLFHDEDDPVTPVGDSRAIAAAWPSARYVETSGLGHHGALGSEDVLGRVMAFLTLD